MNASLKFTFHLVPCFHCYNSNRTNSQNFWESQRAIFRQELGYIVLEMLIPPLWLTLIEIQDSLFSEQYLDRFCRFPHFSLRFWPQPILSKKSHIFYSVQCHGRRDLLISFFPILLSPSIQNENEKHGFHQNLLCFLSFTPRMCSCHFNFFVTSITFTFEGPQSSKILFR